MLQMRGKNSFLLTAASVLFILSSSLSAADFTPPDKAKALDAIKAGVAEACKAGKKIEVWVTLFGSLQKTELVKASEKAVTVNVQKNPFDLSWEKITPDQIAGIGKACVLGDAQRALALADYCMATEQREKADDALDIAAQASQTLGAQLTDRVGFVKKMAGAPVVNAVAASGGGGGGGSSSSAAAGPPDGVPYAAPAKVEFKGSEQGYLAEIKAVAAAVDNAIEIDLAEMGIKPAALADNSTFLRRATLDLTGQIPSPEEVIEFYRQGPDARYKKIEEILGRPEYADHWATFWNVLLVGRRTRDAEDVKIAPFKSWLREQFSKNQPLDKMVFDILTATGENDKNGPVNYLSFHMNDTLPNTMAHLAQSFLGARIGCAQCHDHPFDKWSQQDFWGFAAFLANTRSERRELREDPKDPMRVTKAWHVLSDQNERNGGGRYDPPSGDLRLPPKPLDGPVFSATAKPAAPKLGGDLKKDNKGGKDMAMDKKDMGMDKKEMGMDKKDMKGAMDKKDMAMGMDKKDMGMAGMGMMGGTTSGADGSLGLAYRKALATWITAPENEKFAQSAVNRLWRSMFGYGLVEPVDDIRPKNAPSHPEVMKILTNDFNASGRDFKRLAQIIANTRAYGRASNGDSAKIDRAKAVRYAARAEVRPMTPEELFMAILKSTGGEEKAKGLLAGLRGRDKDMMDGKMDAMNQGDVAQFYGLMQRFIATSTAEDRAGKLQFEGTVSQALMMMHSGFMNDSIKRGVARFQQKGQGDMVYIFAAVVGRPPVPAEMGPFSSFNSSKGGLE